MKQLRRRLERLIRDEGGLQAVEWAVLGAAITLACVSLYAAFGPQVRELVDDLSKLF
jgi:Flp pilus assembly pilin Flp